MQKIYLLFIFGLIAATTQAQEGIEEGDLFFGGNFGFNIGSNTTSINISPQVGYRFNTTIAVGAGINFQYNSLKGDFSRINQTVLGLNIFARVYPVNFLFIQAQPEFNYIMSKIKFYPSNEVVKQPSIGVPSLLLGAGGVLSSGASNGGLIISIFYDVLQHKNSPYGNQPIYNIGYNFGL